jgi:uncharacterized protein (TIGR03437 family)
MEFNDQKRISFEQPQLSISIDEIVTPAPAGSIVSLFLVGAGASGQADGVVATTASNLSVTPRVVVGDQPAEVLYAGPSPGSTVALTQINIRLPLAIGGQLPVFVFVNGIRSQMGATLSVK